MIAAFLTKVLVEKDMRKKNINVDVCAERIENERT